MRGRGASTSGLTWSQTAPSVGGRSIGEMRLPFHLIACLAFLLPGVTAERALAQEGGVSAREAPLVDVNLESMPDGRHRLSRERGRRIVILFYEDRPHVELNDALKSSVHRWVSTNHLEDQVVAYGVANLVMMPSHVPRFLVRSHIAPLVDRWHADILLDWDGIMQRAPWRMVGDTTNVAIVDRSGRLVWHTTGVVDGARRESFWETLRYYLGRQDVDD